MPGQNGFQLTRAITRDPRYADVPIIMCTSKNQETDRVWGMRQGARDYIVKPVDADRADGQDQGLGLSRHRQPSTWPTAKPSANSRAGSPSRLQAARTEGVRPSWLAVECGWREVPFSAARRPARSSPRADACRCRTASAGSSASPTCAAACTAWSTWPAFSARQRCAPSAARDQSRLVALNAVARNQLRAADRPPVGPAQRGRA